MRRKTLVLLLCLASPAQAAAPRRAAATGDGPLGAAAPQVATAPLASAPTFWEPAQGPQRVARAGWFLAGAAGAFVAHELGHVVANLTSGNVPRIVGLRGFGLVPFFAIDPAISCGDRGCIGAQNQPYRAAQRGLYQISAAGFEVQHLGSEVILTRTPRLRHERAPMQKG